MVDRVQEEDDGERFDGIELQFLKTKILELSYNNVDVLHMAKLIKG